MVVISFAIYQSTTETYKLRDVLSNEGEFYNTVRLSMSVMQKDIENIFSPTTMRPGPAPSPSPGAATDAASQDLTPNEFYASSVDGFEIRNSRFHGGEDKLTFETAESTLC